MVPAWIFGKTAIIGISIFTIPIEDIFFTPIFAIFFYALYQVFPKERDVAEKYVSNMYKDGFKFFISENNVWLTEYVPKKYITV